MYHFVYLGLIKARKKDEPEANVIRGEGFKTVAATQYETIIAMTNLAIVNCQIHGRNALNLMVCKMYLMAISCCIINYFYFRFSNLALFSWH